MNLSRLYVPLAVLPALLLAQPALAADGEQTKLDLPAAGQEAAQTQAASAAPGGGSVVRAILGLVVVVGLIYGLTWVLKQLKSSKGERSSGTGLHALATLPLGPNRSLHLVRAGRELVLVGVGEAGVTPIRTYTEPEARSLGLLEEDRDDPVVLATGGVIAAPASSRGSLLDQIRRRTVIR